MSAIGTVLGFAASAASGGLFGLLGSVIGKGFDAFGKWQDQKFRLKEWEHEEKLQALQMQAKAAETEQEVALSNAKGSWEGLRASIDADAKAGDGYPWVGAVKALTRPVLTLGLTAFLVGRMMMLPPGPTLDHMIDELLMLAGIAIGWWFGSRQNGSEKKK